MYAMPMDSGMRAMQYHSKAFANGIGMQTKVDQSECQVSKAKAKKREQYFRTRHASPDPVGAVRD